jgi:hypothetical protein
LVVRPWVRPGDYFLDVLGALCRDGVAVTIVPRAGEAFGAVLVALDGEALTYEAWDGVQPNGERRRLEIEVIDAVQVW